MFGLLYYTHNNLRSKVREKDLEIIIILDLLLFYQ